MRVRFVARGLAGYLVADMLTCASACDDGYETVDIEDVAC